MWDCIQCNCNAVDVLHIQAYMQYHTPVELPLAMEDPISDSTKLDRIWTDGN